MRVSLSKSEIKGEVIAPPSKSYTIRGLMCAALARGESEIVHPLIADDTLAASLVLAEIGVKIDKKSDKWTVTGGGFQTPRNELYCSDSAATLRFMTAICSLVPGKSLLTTGSSLGRRPVGVLIKSLQQLGVRCTANDDLPPVSVEGPTLKGGLTVLAGNISSQYISALLLAAPQAQEKTIIKLNTILESRPYVLMTLGCLQQFGVKVEVDAGLSKFEITPQSFTPAKYFVEGDWSSAAYFLALGAMGGTVSVSGLNQQSLQADRAILDLLRQMNADVTVTVDTITVRKSKLKAIKAELSDCIDLLPIVAVLASAADGTSKLTGISRARLKESDRITAVGEGLESMHIPIREEDNALEITGSPAVRAVIDSKNDHRIAMAFSIRGIITGDMVISGAECVNKTFPEFWEILKKIGGKVTENGK